MGASERFRGTQKLHSFTPRCSTGVQLHKILSRLHVLYGVRGEAADSLTPFGNCIWTQAALEFGQQIAAVAGLQDYKSFT